MKRYLINLLVVTMLTSTISTSIGTTARADEISSGSETYAEQIITETNYEDLRNQWVEELTGSGSYNSNDEDMKKNILRIDEEVKEALDTLKPITDESNILWDDIEDKTSKSATITAHFKRIKTMAIAYKSPGSIYYNDSNALKQIIESVKFMYSKHYNENVTSRPNNWWDWEIGSPRELSEITILLYDELGEFKNNLVAAVNRFVPNATTRLNGIVETGANRVDKALIVTLNAISWENSEKIAEASNALLQVFPYVTSGDGFYKDGSFVQHTNIAYTGSYGLVLINGLANALLLIQQTEHAITDKEYFNMYEWIRDSYAPFISNGGNIIDNVRGRAISRESEQGDIRGKLLISSLLKISQIAPESEKNYIKSMCKSLIKEGSESSEDYFNKMTNNDIGTMKNLINDSSVVEADEENYYKQFHYMDRMMSKRGDYSFSVGMSSARIANYESINNESLKAWYTGQGMTQIYNKDIDQYNKDYWPTVDPYRLAGVTSDGQTRYDGTKNASRWTGGTTVDNINGVSGMEMSPSFTTKEGKATNMSARKSWFSFEDEIVALGSNISSEDRTVETIVENRKIKDDASNTLLVNGDVVTNSIGDEDVVNANWAYLDGNVENSGIGYVFPSKTEISTKREVRTHSWDEINPKPEFATYDKKTRNYVSLAINHGQLPTNSNYEYILLPTKSAEETKEYSENQRVEILSNTERVHGVYHKDKKISAFNVWEAGEITKNMSINSPASIMVKENKVGANISISEPTRSLTSQILTINGDELEEYDIEVSGGISVSKTDEGYTFTINTSNKSGESKYINLISKKSLGENLALNKDVIFSSEETADFKAINVVDGDFGTRWSSERTDDQWLQIDLGDVKTINKIKLSWEGAHAREYKLLVSEDGQNYREIHYEDNSKGGSENISFEDINARYVKFQGISRATKYGYSLYEFQVYGPADTSVLKSIIDEAKVLLTLIPEESVSQELREKLQGEITSAEFIINSGDATAEEIEVAINSINKAIEEFNNGVIIKIGKIRNLEATEATDNSIQLAWDAPEEAVGLHEYIIYKDGKEFATVPFGTRMYTSTDLKANTIYGFKVVSKYSNGKVSKPVSINVRTKK